MWSLSAILVLTLTAPCLDDRLTWSPVPDAAAYRVTRNGALVATQPATAYPVACQAGVWCVEAVDLAGNRSPAVCHAWEAGDISPLLAGDCAIGCEQVCTVPRPEGGCLTSLLPADSTCCAANPDGL